MNLQNEILNKSTPDNLADVNLLSEAGYYPSPADWKDEILYFLMVDRFSDGRDGGRPKLNRHSLETARKKLPGKSYWDWQEWQKSGKDHWQGGTIKGAISRLDYLEKLGITTIWLSPIFKQRGHLNTFHGYGIQNFLEVDYRFGTRADLVSLVKKAHEKDIRIILDIIFNHSGYNWNYPTNSPGGAEKPWYKPYPDRYPFGKWLGEKGDEINTNPSTTDEGVWPKEFQDTDCYTRAGKGNQGSGDAHAAEAELRRSDFENLRDFNLGHAGLLTNLIKCYQYWIALTDCDGMRIDTMKHVYYTDGRNFCGAIKEFADSIGKKNFILIGEVAGGDYFQDNYMDAIGRNMDAVLDIGNMRPTLHGVAKGLIHPASYFHSFNLDEGMGSHRNSGSKHVSILDDHDHVTGEKARFSCESASPEQVTVGIAIQLFSLGIPCIYYGTEQSFMGGPPEISERKWLPDWKRRDVYLREAMFGPEHPLKKGLDGVDASPDKTLPGFGPFGTRGHHCFDEEHSAFIRISNLIKIRKKHPAARSGRQYIRDCSFDNNNFYTFGPGEILAWSRILFDTEVVCVVNTNGREKRGAGIIVDAGFNPEGSSLKILYATDPPFTKMKTVKVKRSPRGASYITIYGLEPSGIVILSNKDIHDTDG